MYWGVSYILYTYDLHHNFGRSLTVKKFNLRPQFKHCLNPAGCLREALSPKRGCGRKWRNVERWTFIAKSCVY